MYLINWEKFLESENSIHSYFAVKIECCYEGWFRRLNISLYWDLPVCRLVIKEIRQLHFVPSFVPQLIGWLHFFFVNDFKKKFLGKIRGNFTLSTPISFLQCSGLYTSNYQICNWSVIVVKPERKKKIRKKNAYNFRFLETVELTLAKSHGYCILLYLTFNTKSNQISKIFFSHFHNPLASLIHH